MFLSKTVVGNNTKLTLKLSTDINTSNSMSRHKIPNIQDTVKHYVCV